MLRIAIVGCTGKLGSTIMKNAINRADVVVSHAIARKGNQYVGRNISELIGGTYNLLIVDDIELAGDCDLFIDCTNADIFMGDSYAKYEKMGKALVIATTAFSDEGIRKIEKMADKIPVFMSGNFSIALHDFIETLKFAVRRISADTDIQIVEYHHKYKKDAPSGTALMIKTALLDANRNLNADKISICSIRGGNIFGEHEVIFANCKDEVVTFRHQVSSRESFADGAIEVSLWTSGQRNGLYGMDDFCNPWEAFSQEESMTNEQRAERLIEKYGFDFDRIPKGEIIDLLQKEIADYQAGSSEYIRLLCGYLYCIGDISDISLLERAKYGINMDVGCMVDGEWIESLKNGGVRDINVNSRQEIIDGFVAYYKDFTAEDD